MNVEFSDRVPDSTYFRRGDAEPRIEDGVIVVLSGQGSRRRSRGAPGVTSTVVVDEADFAAVHVGFYHKHGGSQFWRYYTVGNGSIVQLYWKDLSETQRLGVLDAWAAKAPCWAKRPGKLRSQRLKPRELEQVERTETGQFIGYKWLAVDADGLLYSPSVFAHPRWCDGRLVADVTPTPTNTNGIYAVKSPKSPELARFSAPGRVLVAIALSGVVIEHQFGYRAQVADVIEIVEEA